MWYNIVSLLLCLPIVLAREAKIVDLGNNELEGSLKEAHRNAANYACKKRRKRSDLSGNEPEVLKQLDPQIAKQVQQAAEQMKLDLHEAKQISFMPNHNTEKRSLKVNEVEEEEPEPEAEVERDDTNRNARWFIGRRFTILRTMTITFSSTITTLVGTVRISGIAGQCPGQSITDHYPLC